MKYKIFQAVADELRMVKPEGTYELWSVDSPLTQWISDCNAIANVCQQFSIVADDFDRRAFLNACGIE